MLRFLFFALLAVNISLALPTVSHITTVNKRGESVDLVERRAKQPPKYHSPDHCGTGKPYYIQSVETQKYASLMGDNISPDSFTLSFIQETTLAAVSGTSKFKFVLF